MIRQPDNFTFDPTNHGHKTVAQWLQIDSKSWKSAAQQYATHQGEAVVMRDDGSVILYWRDQKRDTIRQRTYMYAHVKAS